MSRRTAPTTSSYPMFSRTLPVPDRHSFCFAHPATVEPHHLASTRMQFSEKKFDRYCANAQPAAFTCASGEGDEMFSPNGDLQKTSTACRDTPRCGRWVMQPRAVRRRALSARLPKHLHGVIRHREPSKSLSAAPTSVEPVMSRAAVACI